MSIIKILCYDRIEVSEVIDVNKMNESKEPHSFVSIGIF